MHSGEESVIWVTALNPASSGICFWGIWDRLEHGELCSQGLCLVHLRGNGYMGVEATLTMPGCCPSPPKPEVWCEPQSTAAPWNSPSVWSWTQITGLSETDLKKPCKIDMLCWLFQFLFTNQFSCSNVNPTITLFCLSYPSTLIMLFKQLFLHYH